MRSVAVALTLLVFFAEAHAAGQLADDRDTWFKTNEKGTQGAILTGMWAQGVSDALTLVAWERGCRGFTPVSGRTLSSAVTDYLRERQDMLPLVGALIVFERLSGCDVGLGKAK